MASVFAASLRVAAALTLLASGCSTAHARITRTTSSTAATRVDWRGPLNPLDWTRCT